MLILTRFSFSSSLLCFGNILGVSFKNYVWDDVTIAECVGSMAREGDGVLTLLVMQ